jgi:hypothetical protein
MSVTRERKEPVELLRGLEAAHRIGNTVVVIIRTIRHDERISQTVIGDHLAAVITESREIRVVGSDHVVELQFPLLECRVEAGFGQCVPIKGRVLKYPELEPIRREKDRRSSVQGGEAGTGIDTEPFLFVLALEGAGPDLVNRACFGCGETVGWISRGPLANKRAGIVVAGSGVLNDAVKNTVETVTRRNGRTRYGVEFGRRNRRCPCRKLNLTSS